VSGGGAGALAQVFGSEIADGRVSYKDVQKREGISVGNFRAWPVFITDGWQGVEAAVFNREGLEMAFPEFFPNSSSSIRGAIGEAVRNIGQHGHHHRGTFTVGSDEARFAPGGVFLQALSYPTADGQRIPVLLAVVADEGNGIGSPSTALVDGYGDSSRGSQHEGLGVELRASLVYVIRVRNGEWLLYDSSRCETTVRGGEKVVEPVCSLGLPNFERGCQKVMFFVPPLGEALQQDPHIVSQKGAEDEVVRDAILRALQTLTSQG
jgi:anti-sigma regulatory factor (Ser/Thr protein kinase)